MIMVLRYHHYAILALMMYSRQQQQLPSTNMCITCDRSVKCWQSLFLLLVGVECIWLNVMLKLLQSMNLANKKGKSKKRYKPSNVLNVLINCRVLTGIIEWEILVSWLRLDTAADLLTQAHQLCQVWDRGQNFGGVRHKWHHQVRVIF